MTRCLLLSLVVSLLVGSTAVSALDITATPDDYRERIGELAPGDTLILSPGSYPRLNLSGIHGSADAWITITGPESGEPAVITSESCCNTVQLGDNSYLAVENLHIDLGGLFVDGVNAKSGATHDIRIRNNRIFGFPTEDAQQIVGVNTKSTAWNWVIEGNEIQSPGTGMYLGNSDGNAPFINGRVVGNLIVSPEGYCIQIKHQNEYELRDGMAAGPNRTVIANNVFIKSDRPSSSGDRPNLLVGGFPDAGPGSEDMYEVYGNFISYNPRESLIQATGRVSIHDNVLVGTQGTAIVFTNHQGHDVRVARAYHNTIYGTDSGIRIGGADTFIAGNLIFAETPLRGDTGSEVMNALYSVAEASGLVVSPSSTLGEMDFYPSSDDVRGEPLDLSPVTDDLGRTQDFNGSPRGDNEVRGAYEGVGSNPGWSLTDALKDTAGTPPPPPVDGGTPADAGSGSDAGRMGDAGTGPTPDGGPGGGEEDPGGCAVVGDGDPKGLVIAILLFALWNRSRRRLLRG